MSQRTDFKRGMVVRHITVGQGRVAKIDSDVHVVFDHKTRRGKPVIGIYDDNWFRLHGGLLFAVQQGEPKP